MRELTQDFYSDLYNGVLKSIVLIVQNDNTLDFQIRENYINIYYRGGSLAKISARGNNKYKIEFEEAKYLKNLDARFSREGICSEYIIKTQDDIKLWLDNLPLFKYGMDLYFTKIRKFEREFQQILVRENNYSNISRSTDYYICDIEYSQPKADFRFDALAVRWPSNSEKRKNNENLRFVICELKYGDESLEGKSGLKEHLDSIENFCSNEQKLKDIRVEALDIFNKKRKLGLIDCGKDISSFSNEKPETLIILINHDPDKSKLREILDDLPEYYSFQLKFVTANFMGYGLYENAIYGSKEFKQKYKNHI